MLIPEMCILKAMSLWSSREQFVCISIPNGWQELITLLSSQLTSLHHITSLHRNIIPGNKKNKGFQRHHSSWSKPSYAAVSPGSDDPKIARAPCCDWSSRCLLRHPVTHHSSPNDSIEGHITVIQQWTTIVTFKIMVMICHDFRMPLGFHGSSMWFDTLWNCQELAAGHRAIAGGMWGLTWVNMGHFMLLGIVWMGMVWPGDLGDWYGVFASGPNPLTFLNTQNIKSSGAVMLDSARYSRKVRKWLFWWWYACWFGKLSDSMWLPSSRADNLHEPCERFRPLVFHGPIMWPVWAVFSRSPHPVLSDCVRYPLVN